MTGSNTPAATTALQLRRAVYSEVVKYCVLPSPPSSQSTATAGGDGSAGGGGGGGAGSGTAGEAQGAELAAGEQQQQQQQGEAAAGGGDAGATSMPQVSALAAAGMPELSTELINQLLAQLPVVPPPAVAGQGGSVSSL